VDSRAHAAELAFHFSRAGAHGDPSRAVDYQVAAAEEALARLAYESAVDHYRAAQELLAAGAGRDSDERRLEVTMALGDAEWRAGRLEPSRETYRDALALARDLDASVEYARAALGMGFGVGMAQAPALLVDRDLIAALDTALDRVGTDDRVLRAQVITKLASALAWSEERDRALRLADEGVSLARELGDDRTLSATLVEADTVFGEPEDVRRCIAMTTEALSAAERADDLYLQLVASLGRLPHLLQAAEIEELDAALEHTHSLAERLRIPALLCLTTNVDATVAQMEGRLEDAERLVQRFLELGQEAWASSIADSAGAILLQVRVEQGRAEELLPAIEQLAAENPDGVPWHHARLMIFAETGRVGEARAELDRFLTEGFGKLPRDFVWSPLVSWTAEACMQLGERDVRPLYEALLPLEDQVAAIWFASAVGSVAGYLGTYAHLLGENERAAAHFERALEVNRRVRALPYLALAQVRYAALLDEVGDRERATSLRDEARAIADRLGLARIHRLMA
jgi:tetratricopeptide (TPR) repeat protein